MPLPTRTAHWLNLQPGLLAGEPDAYPDLAVAVARASLLGPPRPGAPSTAEGRADLLAWERTLREAPASGSELVQVAGHIGIRITFPFGSLATVARLVQARSRREELRLLSEHFRSARLERAVRIAGTPHLDLLCRALDAALPDRGAGRRLVRGSAEHLDPETAMAFYRWSHHPTRAINVIAGGIDPELAGKVLREAFAEPVEAAPEPRGKQVEVAPIRPAIADPGDTLLVACPVPAPPAAGLSALVELVAGSADGFLPELLRVGGHPEVRVSARRQDTGGGAVLLLTVTDPGVRLGSGSRLAEQVRSALARSGGGADSSAGPGPSAGQVQRALEAIRARRAARTRNQEGLAELLAEQWIRSGEPLPRLDGSGRLAQTGDLDAAALRSLAAQVFAPQRLVLVEPSR